jgi:hypothetical protein
MEDFQGRLGVKDLQIKSWSIWKATDLVYSLERSCALMLE